MFCELEIQVNNTMKALTEAELSGLKHALETRKAMASGNWSRFFKLYRDAPLMTGALIEVFIDKLRLTALQKLSLAFMVTGLNLSFLQRTLAFDSAADATTFLRSVGCAVVDNKVTMNCKSLHAASKKVRRCTK